jgi:hypothetical protein
VESQDFGQAGADRLARVKRGIRVLEDHLNLASPGAPVLTAQPPEPATGRQRRSRYRWSGVRVPR